MKKLQRTLTALAFAGILFWNLTATSHAAVAGDDDPYYTIASVQIRELNEPAVNGGDFTASKRYSAWVGGPKKPNKGGIDLETIINLGKEFWQFIVDNKPVVNIRTDRATALPKGVLHASEL